MVAHTDNLTTPNVQKLVMVQCSPSSQAVDTGAMATHPDHLVIPDVQKLVVVQCSPSPQVVNSGQHQQSQYQSTYHPSHHRRRNAAHHL